MGNKKYDEAIGVGARTDEVTVKGPDGIDASLTPRAALQSAKRLEAAAQVAGRRSPKAWRLKSSSPADKSAGKDPG
jgi:hypothetical protein